jgi:tellurite resistance protein TehA-like permease
MFLTSILHSLSYFKVPRDIHASLMLVFGIVYLFIGILLIIDLKVAPMLAIIFPLIGIGTGVFVIGVGNKDTMLLFLGLIDVIIIICSVALLSARSRQAQTGN